MTTTIPLPAELAPSLAERALALLAEVSPVSAHPALLAKVEHHPPLCVVCHQAGKLGGHHEADGSIEWIHRRCHRKLHARGRLSAREWKRIHAAERHLLAI